MALPGRTIAQGNPPASDHQVDQTELGDWMEEIEEGVADAASLVTRIDTVEDDISDLQALGGAVSAPSAAGGPVAVATTENITLSGEQTIDGVLTSANRVLVKNQTVPAENGIYVSAAGAWSRATDMDAAGEVAATSVTVTGGSTNAGKTFVTYSAVTTLGTDPITWVLAQDQSGLAGAVATKAEQADFLAAATWNLGTAGGTANALTATAPTGWPGWVDGYYYRIIPAVTNTASNVTITVAGVSKTLRRNPSLSTIGNGDLQPGCPCTMVFNAAANRLQIVDVGNGLQEENDMRKQVLAYASATGTANLTNFTVPYIGNTPGEGQSFRFRALGTNTADFQFTINGGATITPKTEAGSNVGAGQIVDGREYRMTNDAGTWRYATYNRDEANRAATYCTATSVGGTANAITASGTADLKDGLLVWLEPTADSTSPLPTFNYNGTGPLEIRRREGQTCISSQLKSGRGVMLRYRTTPALQWRIVADGVTAEEFDAVAADVAVLLEEVPPSDYTYLRDPLVDDPMGSFTIADGVITQVPTEFVITTVGSSVDNAANGSGVDDATYGGKEQWTANQAARAFEAAFSDFGGGLDIIPDQQAVNSQALQSFAAQLAASPYATRKVLIIAPGPNDAGPKSFTSNAVWTSFRGHIESLIEAGRDDGASVLLITPPGYHPDLAPTGLAEADRMQYPFNTYYQTASATFNASEGSITQVFANATYGGQILNPGYQLRVTGSASNDGDYTISSISVDRTKVFVAEPVADETVSCTIQHINIDSEEVLRPRASEAYPSRDWLGDGNSFRHSLRSWWMGNLIRDCGRATNTMVLDWQYEVFKYISGRITAGDTDSQAYDLAFGVQFNHPTEVIYDLRRDLLDIAARRLAYSDVDDLRMIRRA